MKNVFGCLLVASSCLVSFHAGAIQWIRLIDANSTFENRQLLLSRHVAAPSKAQQVNFEDGLTRGLSVYLGRAPAEIVIENRFALGNYHVIDLVAVLKGTSFISTVEKKESCRAIYKVNDLVSEQVPTDVLCIDPKGEQQTAVLNVVPSKRIHFE